MQVVAVPPIEARRKRVTRLEDDPTLLAASEAVKKRFGGKVPAALDIQIADRPGGHGRAVFAMDAAKPLGGDAIVIAANASGAIEWTRDRPTAGIMPPSGPIALAAREAGRIELAVCDPPTKRVALRVWDPEGSPFADFDAMDIEDCAAVSLLHWPRIGEVIVASRPSSTKAQLVTSNGALAWQRGMEIGARTRRGMPASLAADTPESFVFVQLGPLTGGSDAPDHALAFRYDRSGAGLWSKVIDLGEAAKSRTDVEDRIVLSRPRAATVRATIGKGVDVDVTSEGVVTKVVK